MFHDPISFKTQFLGSYIHQLRQSNAHDSRNDIIMEFSLQLLQEPIHISANGFFRIDFKLLGSVSTYLSHFISSNKIAVYELQSMEVMISRQRSKLKLS